MATPPESGTPPFDVLRTVKEFSAIQDQVLCDLAAEMSILMLHDRDTLIRQNDLGATLCVVISGGLGVSWVDEAGIERVLPDIHPGGMVGEVSVLSDTPALATVRARGDAHLAQLSRAGFDRFAARSPLGALALTGIPMARVGRSTRLARYTTSSPSANTWSGLWGSLTRLASSRSGTTSSTGAKLMWTPIPERSAAAMRTHRPRRRNFGSVVKVARDADEFVRVCEKALERPNHHAISRGLKMAGENSWDSIVAQLEQHIFEAVPAISREKVQV